MKDKMHGFAGFPAGKMSTIPLPTLFFTELLPLIDNLGELKVTLHLFWAIGRKQGSLALRALERAAGRRATARGPGNPAGER